MYDSSLRAIIRFNLLFFPANKVTLINSGLLSVKTPFEKNNKLPTVVIIVRFQARHKETRRDTQKPGKIPQHIKDSESLVAFKHNVKHHLLL